MSDYSRNAYNNDPRATEYQVVVSGQAGAWHGQPIIATDDAHAIDQARDMASNMPTNVTFKLVRPDGSTLTEYRRGSSWPHP